MIKVESELEMNSSPSTSQREAKVVMTVIITSRLKLVSETQMKKKEVVAVDIRIQENLDI